MEQASLLYYDGTEFGKGELKMNKKLTTIAIITMILVVTLPSTRAGISNVNPKATETQSSPLQKISPYLQDEMKRNNTSSDKLLRVLIRYDPNQGLALPKGMMVLNKFNIIPLISILASPFEIEELSKLEGVEYIYPDLKVQALNADPQQWVYPDYSKIKDFQSTQYATEPIPYNPWVGNYPCFLNESTTLIGARDLWAQGFTGKGTIIAILDTGINKNHPDLDDLDDDPSTCDPKVLAEKAFIEEPSWEVGDPTDYVGHGTHCASIAAGTGGTGGMNFYGTYFTSQLFNVTILPGTERGVAPGAYLYNVKVLNNEGWGYDSWIVAGIEWAMEHGADVISMSLGGWPFVPPEEDALVLALTEASEHGVVSAVAAGNAGWGYFTVESPGFSPAVITVGATTETDELATFSSRGPEEYELHAKPDILAPGTCIVAAFNYFAEYESYYGYQVFYLEISGTSMATPHVAGAAALLLQAFPGASPYSVKSAIMLGADDLGLDPMAQGAGRLNVAKAYEFMNNSAKRSWSVPVPTNTVTPLQPMPMLAPNLTGKNILIEDSFCNNWRMSAFIQALSMMGANVYYGGGLYSNDSLVDSVTKQPLYDIFILLEPYYVDETLLPPSVLAYYVQQNGTVLFTGDEPMVCTDYDVWTEQWGIRWNNTAVGGHSTRIASHPITTDIHDIYFSSPIDSLILDTSIVPSPECVVWDPILPGVAVWEAQAPSSGKVVVLSDDGILADQYLLSADNFEFGSNIIKWLANVPTIIAYAESPLVPPVESPHPYSPNTDLWYLVSVPSATWINVHFPEIDIESGYDYVRIYDQSMNPVEYFSGYYEDVWTYPAFGNMLWINLQSDSTIQYWGFLADSVMYGINAPPMYHEIGVGGTWEKYVIANSTFTMTVDVNNFGNYTEDVGLYMTLYNGTGDTIIDDWNFENVTVTSGQKASVQVTPNVVLNATTICDLAGTQNYDFVISGRIYNSSSGSPPYSELDYANNMFTGEIASVPKTDRSGPNPLLSVMAPTRIESQSVPLIAMYPNDFTLHNVTAFVGGGDLTNAEFRISGTVTAIADFVNVTTFTEHYWGYFGEWLPDPSPAYFIPNMTATIGDVLDIGDVSAPTMLFAELQIYVASNIAPGTYTGAVQLMNGTNIIASTDLSFEVRTPKSKVLWEDYFNDYAGRGEYGPMWGTDCERLWGGAWIRYVGGSLGVFEWWKQVANAGFDVDSLHQQLHFNEHLGYMGSDTKDPMQVIAYGGYNTMYMHDVDYQFSYQETSVFQQLYETGKMNFAVLFNTGSEAIGMFTTNYGISYTPYFGMSDPAVPPMIDMLVTGVDKTHPIFKDVENFTLSIYPYEGGYVLKVGPYLYGEDFIRLVGKATGIATGISDLSGTSGFVVAVNELQATPHVTSRMVVVSDGNMFESLEYEDYLIWINMFMINGENTIVSRVDTSRFAVNMLEWLTPQFANTAPKVNYATVAPDSLKPGETASVDLVASDAENDSFTVTIAVRNPDGTWNNATISPIGGHWLREFTVDQVGAHKVYAVATDQHGAQTMIPIGTVNVINNPPAISSILISPHTVTEGDKVFITVGVEDVEDGIPAQINVTITSPDGTIYNNAFTNTRFANVVFDTTKMIQGIYNIVATATDSKGAQTTANIGSFEVIPAPMVIPVKEIGLGVGIMALIALIAIAMLLWRRPLGSTPTPPPT
jgi:subtilisin family serine protease